MDLKIEKIVVGSLKTNCYLGIFGNGEAFIVDPGDEAARIIAEIERSKASNLKYVLLTHGHYDHVLAVDDLYYKYPNTSIIIHEDDIKLMANTDKQGIYIGKRLPKVSAEVVAVSGGGVLKIADKNIEVIHTPGHTKGSVCYRLGDILFSGDTLFKGTYGRIDLPWSEPGEMKESLDKILHLPGEIRVLPGHGRETTIKEELEFYGNDRLSTRNHH